MKAVFLEQFARIGKALSSPVRLLLVDLLSQSEKSVETLVQQSGSDLKNVSAQLRVLKEAGLVQTRREGKYVFYSLSDDKVGDFWSTLQDFSSRQLSELQVITQKLIGDPDSLEKIDRKTLLARAKKQEVIVLDVRPTDEYNAGHLPYAMSMPLEQLKEKLKSLPKDKEFVAYCRGPYCLLAVEAVKILNKSGFKAVRLDDGVRDWKRAGFPVESNNSRI